MAEMVTVLGTVYGMEGIDQVEATDRVEFIFSLLDTNRNRDHRQGFNYFFK